MARAEEIGPSRFAEFRQTQGRQSRLDYRVPNFARGVEQDVVSQVIGPTGMVTTTGSLASLTGDGNPV
jgi:hypothetical protein